MCVGCIYMPGMKNLNSKTATSKLDMNIASLNVGMLNVACTNLFFHSVYLDNNKYNHVKSIYILRYSLPSDFVVESHRYSISTLFSLTILYLIIKIACLKKFVPWN